MLENEEPAGGNDDEEVNEEPIVDESVGEITIGDIQHTLNAVGGGSLGSFFRRFSDNVRRTLIFGSVSLSLSLSLSPPPFPGKPRDRIF